MKCTVEVKPEGFVITAEDGHYSVVLRNKPQPARPFDTQDLVAELLIALGLRNEI